MTQSAMETVCSEILLIMAEYDRQMEKSGYVDTPGGLEHMGDVWSRLGEWRNYLLEDEDAESQSQSELQEEADAIEWNDAHPELRCPPRE